jgi:multidrug efflux pump subunit AcrB
LNIHDIASLTPISTDVMLAFIPLTQSSFWGALANVLIGGVGAGTMLTLLFLPALYAIWFKVKQPGDLEHRAMAPA